MKPDVKHGSMKSLKERYSKEYSFVSDLLDRVNLPTLDFGSSDSEVSSDEESKGKDKVSVTEHRAQSLLELHQRLAALKEQKYTYRGKKLKTKLQSKLKRKKKIHENKTKRNVLSKDGVPGERRTKIEASNIKPSKPVFNSNGNLVFSKFDFLGETTSVTDKKVLTKDVTNKKSALEKLQKTQNYVKKLEEVGKVGTASHIKDEIKWKNALKKAEGIKVKDDVQLLKKSLAKKQAKKKVSEKKWNERLRTVEKQKLEKQKKRKENIEKKVQEKKKKKLKKATKKGRYIPNV